MHTEDNVRLEHRKFSNGRKIARMARILTKFGPKKSQRRKLFDENFRTIETNEKAPKSLKNDRKKLRKFQKLDIADVINY